MSTSGSGNSNNAAELMKMTNVTADMKLRTTTNMNADLRLEREGSHLNVERLTNMFDGSADRTARRRYLEALIARDPTGVFSNEDNAYLHRTDRYVRSVAKFVRLAELCRHEWKIERDGHLLLHEDFPTLLDAMADDMNISLHWIMFVPNILSLCDEQQQQEWIPLCRDWKMIGCYAQTELGHGSNVRALETTATFKSEAQGSKYRGGSFVIHSPTLTSTKFWPGTLGRTANHAMLIARLIDGNGKDQGIHNFLVPLRSLQDHSLLPGVTTGDIGPKIGYNAMDNGFATFDHVEIPRRNMAMRFATVDEQGRYAKRTQSEAAGKVAYITMMQVRALIVHFAGKALAMACTIVTRYSAVRRQGFDGSDSVTEKQILDYKQQQHRIFPLLAASYGFFFTGQKVLDHLRAIEQKLVNKTGNVTKAQVADVHATSSGLKSYVTTMTADGIEDCRKACGGHGFLQSSGLPELMTTYLQNPTVEGDNHMLPQQVVKVLLKLVEAIQNEQDLSDYHGCDSYDLVPSLQAIMHGTGEDESACKATSETEMRQDLQIMLVAFRHRAARLLLHVAEQLQTGIMEQGLKPLDAWNRNLVEMARTSRAYSQFLLLRNFIHGIQQQESSTPPLIGLAECQVLKDLARLLGLYWMERELGDFLEDEYMTAEQAQWIRSGVLHMLDVIRPHAVALVDARDFSDFRLKSALGRYDGDVYPHILEAAKRDPLNAQPVGPGYDPHLKRLIVDGVAAYNKDKTKPAPTRLASRL